MIRWQNVGPISVQLLSAVVLVGCPSPSVVNPHFVPQYVCEGDPISSAVAWSYTGPVAEVQMFTALGEFLCSAPAQSGLCIFNRPLNQDDVPIDVKGMWNGQERVSISLNYEVLSGPTETQEFMSNGVIEGNETTEVTIDVPIYGHCDTVGSEPPNRTEECTTNEAGVETCVCPDEGQIIDTRQETVKVNRTFPQALTWTLGYWFAPRVQTRQFKYIMGEGNQLRFSGPGIAGAVNLIPGGSVSGNNANPGGLWVGEIPPEANVTTLSDSSDPVFPYSVRLTVACQ